MPQVDYVWGEQEAAKEAAMKIVSLARGLAQWRRLALVSFGALMGAVIAIVALILGRL